MRCLAFAGAEITPGAATSWRVSRADFRHYTPAVIDGDALSVIIALHGSGEGEQLLLGLQPGDELTVLKWAVKRSFAWQDGDRPIVVVGDGTVISLAMRFERRIGDSGRGFRAVLVGGRGGRRTGQHLGRTAVGAAGECVGGEPAGQAQDAQTGDDDAAGRPGRVDPRQQHRARPEVPVDLPVRMGEVEGIGQSGGQRQHLVVGQPGRAQRVGFGLRGGDPGAAALAPCASTGTSPG